MKNTQKALAAATLVAFAGTAFAQVSPGPITPDLTEDYEGTPGGRAILNNLFGGLVPVISGVVTHNSVDFGNWSDFRASPAVPIQPSSGTKFGVGFGFGDFTLDFTGVGGITGIEMFSSAAGVGDDVIEFFDMGGGLIDTFIQPGGFGGGGLMEFVSFNSTVTIGSIRLTGRETTYDDLGVATDPSFCPVSENPFTPVATEDYEGTPGGRVVLNELFGGDVTVIAGVVTHNSVDQGNWSDFRASPAAPIVPSSGTKFGVGFGFGDFTLDFTGIGGIDGFQGMASAAGVGDDELTFFDMDGNELCTFTIVGGFGPGDGTMEDFSYTSITKIGSVRLTGRESTYDDLGILQPPPPPPPGAQVIVFTGQDTKPIVDNAVAAAGIIPDLRLDNDFPGLTNALNNPDFGLAIISNPCCFFDAGTPGALDTFVANGNSVHMSFWDMDANPALQSTFGIASAVDFFDPRPVFNNAGHPSWGSAGDVPIDPAFSPWFDNGDSMTAASGGTVVGTFDFSGGDGAIIVANDDRTLFNGFDYDSLDTAAVTDLVTAQLNWIPKPGAECRADIDGDGVLTFFDFLEFQNLFAMGDLRADFDGDGVLTFFDFLEFQNEFAIGCD